MRADLLGASISEERDTAVARLMTGSFFTPESVTVISVAYTVVLSELGVELDHAEAGELAMLLMKIASDEAELDVAALVAKAKAAWRDRGAGKG